MHIHQIVLLILIFTIELQSLNNPYLKIPDCKIYREGNFDFISLSNGIEYKVIREKYFQKVFVKNPNYYVQQEIVWVSNCIYRVKETEITDPDIKNLSNHHPFRIGKSFYVHITSNRTKDFYEYYYITTDGKKYFNKMFVSRN